MATSPSSQSDTRLHSPGHDRRQQDKKASLSSGVGSSADVPEATSTLLSNLPGKSGIAPSSNQVEGHSSSPTASSPSFHFPRRQRDSSLSSSFTGNQSTLLHSGTRSRQSRDRAALISDSINDDISPRISLPSGETSISGGKSDGAHSSASATGSSAWSFFRESTSASSSQYNDSKSPGFMSDRTGSNSDHAHKGAKEGSVTPQILTSGTATPLGLAGAPIDLEYYSSHQHRLSTSLQYTQQQQHQENVSKSASFVVTESIGSSVSVYNGFPSANSKRKSRQASTPASSHDIGIDTVTKKADGLVAMAARERNTINDTKIVVAGRSLLKILSVSQRADDKHPLSEHDERIDTDDEEAGTSYFARRHRTSRRHRVHIQEELDLQAGLSNVSGKNSKAALVNDVSWGYACQDVVLRQQFSEVLIRSPHIATKNKIMTGNSNGTVALYDIEKSGRKLERLKAHHQSGRAINVVAFAGPQGTLLASGCQDGDIKLSDIRHTSLITLSTPLDPIRSMCFAPRENSTADPFQLIAANESGSIARWDLRSPKNPLDRTMAHQGGVLSVAWKGSISLDTAFESASNLEGENTSKQSSNDPWGWLATAGMDGSVKIWDMSSHLHVPRCVHTLNVNRPIQSVQWHTSNSRPCEVIVVPSSIGSTIKTLDDQWQPDIEIWDVRKEHLPKQIFWTNGSPVSTLSPACNSDVIWCLNRNSAIFEQIDIEKEAVEPESYYPRVAAAWSAEGVLAFALNKSDMSGNVSNLSSNRRESLDEPIITQNQTIGLVTGLDPTFEAQVFRYLANEYEIKQNPAAPVADLFDRNTEVAMAVNRYDIAKIWKLAALWLDSAASGVSPASFIETHLESTPSKSSKSKSPSPGVSLRRVRSQTSPSTPFHTFQKRELYMSRQTSPLVTSQILSEADISPQPLPSLLPKAKAQSKRSSNDADLVGSDTASEPADKGKGNSEEGEGSPSSLARPPNSDSSEDENASDVKQRSDIAPTAMTKSVSSIITKKRPSLAATSRQSASESFKSPKRHSESVGTLESRNDSSPTLTPRTIHNTSTSRSPRLLQLSEMSATDAAHRTEVYMPEQATLTSARVRRTSSQTQTARQTSDSEAEDAGTCKYSDDGDDEDHEGTAEGLRARAKRIHRSLKRSGSYIGGPHIVPGSQARQRRSRSQTCRRRRVVSNNDAIGHEPKRWQTRSTSTTSRSRTGSKLRALAIQRKLNNERIEAKTLLDTKMKDNLLNTIQELADEGDIQTSASLAFVLCTALDIDPKFLARLTSAYLKLLKQLDCHLSAAYVTKTSSIEAVRLQSQENTTLYTACGKCGKGISAPPFTKCRKCSAFSTICSIWEEGADNTFDCVRSHEVEAHTYVFCATCGHGAHEECLYAYAAELSQSHFSVNPFEEAYLSSSTHPSAIKRDTGTTTSGVGTTAGVTPIPSPAPSSSPLIASSASSVHWLFPAEQALFSSSSAFPSRAHSRAASPEFDPMEFNRANLLGQCPSGCGHACLLMKPLFEQ